MSFPFAMSETTHKEFNAFVQRVQQEAMQWGVETRLEHQISDRDELALFMAYWDGQWWPLASERPFVVCADRDALINPGGWLHLQQQMASAVVSS